MVFKGLIPHFSNRCFINQAAKIGIDRLRLYFFKYQPVVIHSFFLETHPIRANPEYSD